MLVHQLKILPCYFGAHLKNIKPWEIRLDDRMYFKGDILVLNEFVPESEWCDKAYYTGRKICREITAVYSLPEYLKDGYVVLSLKKINKKTLDKLNLKEVKEDKNNERE